MTDAVHLINRVVSAWNSHDAVAVTALHAPDSTVQDTGIAPPARGSDEIRARARTFISGIGDLRVIPGVVLGTSESVAYKWQVIESHAGVLLEIPPTGRPIDVCGVTIFELDGEGMIVSERLYWNVATLLAQISTPR